MSREHAVLKADPDTRVCQASSLHLARADFPQSVFIEDVGSMHGTYVGDRRIRSHERHPLHYDNLVKFGNEVTRGPGTYPENGEAAPLCCQPTLCQSSERQALSEECCLTVHHYQNRFLHSMLLCGILGLTIGIELFCFTLNNMLTPSATPLAGPKVKVELSMQSFHRILSRYRSMMMMTTTKKKRKMMIFRLFKKQFSNQNSRWLFLHPRVLARARHNLTLKTQTQML
jgi:FHA domain